MPQEIHEENVAVIALLAFYAGAFVGCREFRGSSFIWDALGSLAVMHVTDGKDGR